MAQTAAPDSMMAQSADRAVDSWGPRQNEAGLLDAGVSIRLTETRLWKPLARVELGGTHLSPERLLGYRDFSRSARGPKKILPPVLSGRRRPSVRVATPHMRGKIDKFLDTHERRRPSVQIPLVATVWNKASRCQGKASPFW